ncbi:hypothetical protein BKP35_18445 [Anaerobacillus arseniciselenatis]|uniref:Uncharacterized protein n=1 Tax=Anaerobacillus arseniciselenatis TaxID=85682 RepID=A0A1S2L595_9BACI|nr:hypothetical protein [Anaerobacillus arseniciselenatis]OIJ07662.1 hypothetical protein BKP35_18445 [Anaerobacillus arseniciselenatis]
MPEEKAVYEELRELKTKVALLEDRLTKFDEVPTYEKTKNMINHSLKELPNDEKIIVLIQDTIKKEDLVTNETVEKELSKLKLWLYVTVVGLVGMGFKLFL